MDPKQALEVLMNAAARAAMTKVEHINAENAYSILLSLLNKKPDGETTS